LYPVSILAAVKWDSGPIWSIVVEWRL